MADRNQLLPVPLPIRGLNTMDGITLPWDSGFARELTNYSIYNGKLQSRPANRNVFYNTIANGNHVEWFDVSSAATDGYAILADGKIRRMADGSGAATIGGAVAYKVTRVKHSSLDLAIGAREPRLAANPFTAWTITTNVVTATAILAACSHKGRLYVADTNTLEYSSVSQVTGAMPTGNSYPLAEYLDGQSIVRIFSVTVSPGNDSQNILMIFGDGGRVLAYAGDFPGSSSWNLMGRFDMPRPGASTSFLEIDGDVWVASNKYAYWARALFNGGAAAAYASSPSKPIENVWSDVRWEGGSGQLSAPHCWYEPRVDAIITQCTDIQYGNQNFNLLFTTDAPTFNFAYFRKYNAWAVWNGSAFYHPIITNTSGNTPIVYGTGAGNINKLVYTMMRDEQMSIPVEYDVEATWKTPYFPSGGRGHKVNGVRPFFENSVSGYFEKARAIFDYSDFNSPLGWYTQSTVTAILPGNYGESQNDAGTNTYNQYTALMGAAGAGGAFSLQFTQKPKAASSDSQIQSIYAAGVYIEPGSSLF